MLGPVNSAETNYSGRGSHGGYVYFNRIDPTNSQKMFVSFVTGGLWLTTDGGVNWTLTDTGFSDQPFHDIDVCISNPQIVYALNGAQLLKSVDGGMSWQETTLNADNYIGQAYDIAVSPTNPDVVIARWGLSIYKTIDGGNTWTTITNLPLYDIWDCSIHSEMLDWSTTDTNVVYFLSTSNDNKVTVYRSSNSGTTFSLISTITLDPTSEGNVIGWAKLMLPNNNANSIYVSVGSGNNSYAHQAVHLYKLNAVTGSVELSRINMVGAVHSTSLHHGDIAMDRTNENNIVWGGYADGSIYVSTDNGQNFAISASTMHSDIRTIDFVNDTILVGNDGEAVITFDNGATNTTITNSISNHELWGFGSAFKTDVVASGNNHGPMMVKEAANGFDWYNGPGADQGNTDVNPLDDRYIYSQGYSNYRFFRTGVHTITNESNYLDLGGIYSYFNSIEFHPNKYYSMITHHAGQYPTGNPNLNTWKNSLIKTEDNGNSISVVKTFTDQVFREKISMKNPNHMYVVVGVGIDNKLWHTADAGLTWTDITPSPLTVTAGVRMISDIAVSDENPNELWVTYSGVQTICKVLKTTNAGVNWSNLTQTNLTSSPLTKIIFQRGSDGGVYIGNKAGVFYKNNTMSNWQLLGAGLPMCDVRFMFINYNQNKLKIGTSRGAFTHNLYEISPPNALISAENNKITCPSVDGAIQFKDYSVVRNNSATWSWDFPGGTPATSTDENPLISYQNAVDGFYDVTLTVTDAYGTSTQTLTNFIEVTNLCGSSLPETIPGNVAQLESINNDYLKIEDLNLTENSFTFSCWIKPNGIQEDYSSIFSSIKPGNTSHFALNFLGGDNSIGFHPHYSWNSGLKALAGEWSHIVFVSNGTDVRIYVNGVESIYNTGLINDSITNLILGWYGYNYSNRHANLEIEEVCVWNRALTIDEVRAYRHLTKTNASDPILNGLVGYYQFNELAGNVSLNKITTSNNLRYKGSSATNHNQSSAPVFGGKSEKKNINSAGLKSFTNTGFDMDFQNGTYPNGDVWVSQSTINPDVLPDNNTNFDSYTIVNNYGSNQIFSPLQSLSFYNNNSFINTNAEDYYLYKRTSNAFANTWEISLIQEI